MLVVDDEPMVLRSVSRILETGGYSLQLASSGKEALAALSARDSPPPDVVLTDLHLSDMTGFEILVGASEALPNVASIVMTGQATIASAVEAMRRGAYDYLVKPFQDQQILLSTIERAVNHKRLIERNQYLEQRLGESERFEDLVGASAGMRSVASLVETVGPTDATVLVLGESGTGKELVVRAIHRRSRRREKPFMAINCGALADSVLESELFGHTKGAFTGAVTGRKGLFEEASGGTVFLDEVGELPAGVQVRLLRVLQEREVKPVGSNDARPVDVRVVAATNRDLAAEVAAGRFRQDLFYRLNVVPIDVPPLRARLGDVPLLALHFVRKHAPRHQRKVAHIDANALELLSGYEWPGTVRELENTIERAVVLCTGDTISDKELPSVLKAARSPNSKHLPVAFDLPLARAKHDFERNYLQRLLLRANGNLMDAARAAGLDRSNLRRLLRRYEIDFATAKDSPAGDALSEED